MCHLRSLGRVANFKNEAFRNWGRRFDFLASLTCCTCCRMIIRGVGVGGCINVLDKHFSDVRGHVHVAHAVLWSSDFPYVAQHVPHGGGVLTFLTSSALTLRNMSPLLKWRPVSMLHKKNQKVHKKRDTWAYSPTWRDNVALLQSVAAALPKALWHSKRERTGWVDVFLRWLG